MSAWSIDPASVGNIIESEKTEADTNFNTALTGISNAESGLITATQTVLHARNRFYGYYQHH